MKRKRNGGICCVLVLLILGIWVWKLSGGADAPEAGTYGEADRIITAFARDNGLSLGDYPEELRALLERNPETEEFVLRYPLDREEPVEADLSDYAGEAGVPLFLLSC